MRLDNFLSISGDRSSHRMQVSETLDFQNCPPPARGYAPNPPLLDVPSLPDLWPRTRFVAAMLSWMLGSWTCFVKNHNPQNNDETNSSMVRASHWSSEGYRLYTYVTFTHHLSPCSSMVRASHWSSEGYRLYTYVTFTHHLSTCS